MVSAQVSALSVKSVRKVSADGARESVTGLHPRADLRGGVLTVRKVSAIREGLQVPYIDRVSASAYFGPIR